MLVAYFSHKSMGNSPGPPRFANGFPPTSIPAGRVSHMARQPVIERPIAGLGTKPLKIALTILFNRGFFIPSDALNQHSL
jgi:hypothetical protein